MVFIYKKKGENHFLQKNKTQNLFISDSFCIFAPNKISDVNIL